MSTSAGLRDEGPRGEAGAPARLRTPTVDTDDLPRGSFGAGGWSPGGKGCYPRMSREDAVAARRTFKQLLLNKYHSMARAWRDLDINGDGKLSFFEFCRACQRLGVAYCPRQLWDAMDIDRSSFVTLDEVDPEISRILGDLALVITEVHGTVEDAWRNCFNRRNGARIDIDYFSRACSEVGFDGDHGAAFQALRADKASTGISRKEFGLLELWSTKEPPEYASPLHDAAAEDQLARAGDPKDMMHFSTSQKLSRSKSNNKEDVKLSSLDEFKKLLLQSYGNMVCAWRQGLDYDHNGRLDYNELQKACKNIGYAGNRKDLWNELDVDVSGVVSLRELDEETAQMLEDINKHAVRHYGTWQTAWRAVMDVRDDDRVGRQAFVEGCQMLGYTGPAERLFDLLDMDRVRYLTLAGTSWLGGIEEEVARPEKECFGGDLVVSGAYKGMTRSQIRKMEDLAREKRMREARFEARNRAELSRAGNSSLRSTWSSRSSPSLQSTSKQLSAGTSKQSLSLGATTDCIFPTSYTVERVSLSPKGTRKKAPPDRSPGPKENPPGKGGWPTQPTRVKDAAWIGGEKHERIQELLQLTRKPEPHQLCAVSGANLGRWLERPFSTGER